MHNRRLEDKTLLNAQLMQQLGEIAKLDLEVEGLVEGILQLSLEFKAKLKGVAAEESAARGSSSGS